MLLERAEHGVTLTGVLCGVDDDRLALERADVADDAGAQLDRLDVEQETIERGQHLGGRPIRDEDDAHHDRPSLTGATAAAIA